MHFENIANHLGLGKYHKCILASIFIVSIFGGVHQSSLKFIFPLYNNVRCFVPNCDNENSTYENQPWIDYTIPKDEDGYSECLYFVPHSNDCAPSSFSKNETMECNKWLYKDQENEHTVSELYGMVCKRKKKKALSDSLFMVGNLVGAMGFGRLSDKFGRKIVFLIAPAVMLGTSIGTAFSSSLILFNFLRFFTSACAAGLFQTGYVLAIEFIGGSKRLWLANIMQMIFAVGELILALLAYFIRDWKTLQLVISVPTVLLLGYYWLLPESVRWQITHGEHEKAIETILRAARWNKVQIPSHLLTQEPEVDTPLLGTTHAPRQPGVLDIFRSQQLRRSSLNLWMNWFVNALVYYGISFSAGNLGGNIYANFAILSFIEIPSEIIVTFALQRFGRRPVLTVLLILSGSACISSALVPKGIPWVSTILAVIGKGAIAGSFATVYIYSAEIYPTVLRNTGIGISNTASRLGSIVSPFILYSSKFYKPLPYLIFGGLAIIVGFATLDLPETLNKQLPETVEEAENLRRGGGEYFRPLI